VLKCFVGETAALAVVAVICKISLLGRCRRHSFGMQSKPRAFPDFKDCISFDMSQG
jgi:hypothetical protein